MSVAAASISFHYPQQLATDRMDFTSNLYQLLTFYIHFISPNSGSDTHRYIQNIQIYKYTDTNTTNTKVEATGLHDIAYDNDK